MIREVNSSDTDRSTDPSPSARAGIETHPQGDIPEPTNLPATVTVKPVTGVKRMIFIFFAGLFFVLGIIGAILPVIPTTPFLLLTSFFLIRISPRLNEALMRAPLVGPVLRDWNQRRGVRPSVKIQAIVIVLCFIGSSLYFAPVHVAWKSLLMLLGVVGIVVILRIPTLRNGSPSDNSDKSRS